MAINKEHRVQLVRDTGAADMTDVCRATWWDLVRRGIMPPPIKIGGSTRWRVDEIEAAIERVTAEQRKAG